MKPLYLICQLSAKDKLTVIQKVTGEELKQIELNLALAKKYNKEIQDLGKEVGYRDKELNNTWYNMRVEFAKIAGLGDVEDEPSPTNTYIDKYDNTIVIPYTKILE